jgi:hypothetical protein
MAQYGTHHVDIDEKKAELFRRGLCLLLQDRLVKFCDTSFNTLVSVVIAQDGTYQALLEEEEEKRNRDLSEPSDDSTEGAPLKYRLVYTSSAGKSRVPPPPPSPQCDHHPPQQQMLPHAPVQAQPQKVLSPTLVQSPQTVLPHAPQQKTTVARACASTMDVLGTLLSNVLNPRGAKHQEFQHQQ